MDKVRVGVVGTSWFADLFHLPLMGAVKEAKIEAICGRNQERAEEIARKYAIPAVYSDYRELMACGKIDAVVIVTPDTEHYPMVMRAIGEGLHVFCEKPLSYTLPEAREMRDAAAKAGIVAMVNHTYRWFPVYVFAKELLAAESTGPVLRASFDYFAGRPSAKGTAWRFDAARSNGALGDLGSHMIDLARYLVGDIVEVTARLDVRVPHEPTVPVQAPNDLAALLVGFDKGAAGQIRASKVDYRNGQLQRVELHCESASFLIESTMDESTIRQIAGDEREEHVLTIPAAIGGKTTGPELTKHFVANDVGPRLFVRSILGEASPAPTFEDGYRVQEVIDAANRSNETGVMVRV